MNEKQLQLKLEVVYEDDYLAIINKPAGILVSGNTFKTVNKALQQNLQFSTVADAVAPKTIHRLDYATTGLLLVGKTNQSVLALNEMFVKKEISKTYLAITIGNMELHNGTINTPIDNKISISTYKVIDRVISERFKYLNLVELNPKTGRRHQLRKHLHSIGHPILGDKVYKIEGLQLNGKGLYLHALALKFLHPITQELLNIQSEIPKRFSKIFGNYVG